MSRVDSSTAPRKVDANLWPQLRTERGTDFALAVVRAHGQINVDSSKTLDHNLGVKVPADCHVVVDLLMLT
jgi:hypothetical protein